MKKVIIIILAVFLAIDIGVLAYGITRGSANTWDGNVEGLKVEPDESVYADAEEYVPFTVMNDIADPAERMASLLINASYNLVESTGFFVKYRTDIEAEDGSKSCSENLRALQGTNEVYQTLTSGSSFEKRQITYYTEELRLQDFNLYYDKATDTFLDLLNSPSSKDTTPSKKGKNTYIMRSWFDFPLYLGGKDKAANAGDLVWDSIDGATVTVKEDKKDYITYTFDAVVDKANEYEDAYHYLSYGSIGGDQGGGSVNHIESMTFEVSFWKSGLIREMIVVAAFDGELLGKSGKATVTKTCTFSYAKSACSTAYWLYEFKWYEFLNKENKVKFKEEIAEFKEIFRERAKTKEEIAQFEEIFEESAEEE